MPPLVFPSTSPFLLPSNPRPPSPLRLITLPTPIRQKILSKTSISALLTLSTTHPTFRTDIHTSNTITDTVFNSTHNFRTSRRPPTVQKLLFSDPYLHPLFAKAIAESYDGAESLTEDLTSREYFSWLQQRCYVVHLIDRCFSEIQDDANRKGKGKKREYCGIEGIKRKIILLQFWRLLDCLENWSISVSASLDGLQDGYRLTSDDYFGWCVDFVKGFKHAILSDEEREDLSEVVGFFMEIPPARLVKGGDGGEGGDGFWRFMGMRNYELAEMRGMGGEEGMEREMARGIGRWVGWERDRAERKRWDARWDARWGRREVPRKRRRLVRNWSGDDRGEDKNEGRNNKNENDDDDKDDETQDNEGAMAEDTGSDEPRIVAKRRAKA
ncbi:hypothetical protein C7212DRAFT_342172 [Tuber magnatum]|uniref:F-box domain-containing protein n=1 Tax=Tuber magnatum TaxID=42249 RepID=A0A317T2Q2_9PEZI|nr:hypothetical protein C7212DRAFT_342172 [Tuber magnatum]